MSLVASALTVGYEDRVVLENLDFQVTAGAVMYDFQVVLVVAALDQGAAVGRNVTVWKPFPRMMIVSTR